jgi:hypothetical protein
MECNALATRRIAEVTTSPATCGRPRTAFEEFTPLLVFEIKIASNEATTPTTRYAQDFTTRLLVCNPSADDAFS